MSVEKQAKPQKQEEHNMGKAEERIKRKKRIRGKVNGTQDRPRLAVFRSNMHIYAQIVNDEKASTLVFASDKDLSEADKKKSKIQRAKLVGDAIAKKAVKKHIKKVVFDRGGFIYHGRVKALAEGARNGGLEF